MVDGALGHVHPPGLAPCLHVVGQGHVVAPHVISDHDIKVEKMNNKRDGLVNECEDGN